jgi:hypothetical protein
MSISINGSEMSGMRAFDSDSSEKEIKSASIDPPATSIPAKSDTDHAVMKEVPLECEL